MGFASPGHSAVRLNEIVASNGIVLLDEDEDYSDWIEFINLGPGPVDLTGYGLSDDPGTPFRWVFPETRLEAGAFLLVWASGKDRRDPDAPLHANFSIVAEGEPLQLTAPDGGVADFVAARPIPRDLSLGRVPDGTGEWFYFDRPTPRAPNTTTAYAGLLDPPVVSPPGGYHPPGLTVALSHPDPEVRIYHTLDGSFPNPGGLDGTSYSHKENYALKPDDPFGELLQGSYRTFTTAGPIAIDPLIARPNHLVNFNTTYRRDASSFAPEESVFKGVVVRARAFREGYLPSPIATHTYFVTPGGAPRYDIPVISLAFQEDHLFDYHFGIYNAGVLFDTWRLANPDVKAEEDGWTKANYRRTDEHCEKLVGFEMFDPTGARVVSQHLAARIHGGRTRSYPQKSLRLSARRSSNDPSEIDYPFFPELTDRIDGSPITSFTRVLLRNSGNDYKHTRLRDAFLHTLLGRTGIDTMASLPAVHFINGEYWGLVTIRERQDRYFIASHHGIDPDDVAMMSSLAGLEEGTLQDRADWLDLRNYIIGSDMTDPAHLEYVEQRLDLDNFLLYNALQIYIVNTDWPGNNLRYWRKRTPDQCPLAPPSHDGRWRWILYDLDFGFGPMEHVPYDHTHDTLTFATETGGPYWPNPDWSTVLLRRLLENPRARDRFVTLMADHINTTFVPERVEALVDKAHGRIAPYLPEHRARWRDSIETSPAFLKEFGRQRAPWVFRHVAGYFELPDRTHRVTVATPFPGWGSVRVNTVVVERRTPGLLDPATPYPWSGLYPEGVPLEIEARPAPGYRFLRWLERPDETATLLQLDPTEPIHLTALFLPLPARRLLHYWNFNDSVSEPSFTQGGASLTIAAAEASTTATLGTGNGFAGANARDDDPAGAHLRVNNPLGATLSLSLPTTGHAYPVLRYETRRSGQGAGRQVLEYTLDGTTYRFFGGCRPLDGDPVVEVYDFASIPDAHDNARFGIRLAFSQGDGGEAGNHRFDNITLEAVPLDALATLHEGRGFALR